MMCIGNVIGVSIQSCAPVGKKEVNIKFSIEKNRALPEVKWPGIDSLPIAPKVSIHPYLQCIGAWESFGSIVRKTQMEIEDWAVLYIESSFGP